MNVQRQEFNLVRKSHSNIFLNKNIYRWSQKISCLIWPRSCRKNFPCRISQRMTSSGAWASNGPTPTPWTPSTCPEEWRSTRPTRWWTTTATATPGTFKKVVLAKLQESLNWSLPGKTRTELYFARSQGYEPMPSNIEAMAIAIVKD